MPQLYDILPAPTIPSESAHIRHLPILILNLHTHCNCRCVMCDIWQRKDPRAYPAEDLERHRTSLRNLGTQHVVLTGGEPLLHRELEAICAFFHSLDIRITLLTTGLLLRSKAAIVTQHIDDIILSLDGPPHIHDAIRRVPRAFRTIAQGIDAVRALRPAIPIACRTTVQRMNHTHLRATVEAAHTLRLDSISFLPADVSSTAFNREQPWQQDRQQDIALNAAEVEALAQEVEHLIQSHAQDIRSDFIVESEAKLRRIAQRFRERIEGTPPRAPICNAPWVSTVIEADGSIRPCFFHPPTGSVQTMSLEEAINTSAARSFRDRLDVATNPTCARCVCSLNYRNTDPITTP